MEPKKPLRALIRLCRFISRISSTKRHKSTKFAPTPIIPEICLTEPEKPTFLHIPNVEIDTSSLASPSSLNSPRITCSSFPPTPDYIKNGELWSARGNSFFPDTTSNCSQEFTASHEDVHEFGDSDSPEPRDWAIAQEDLEIGQKLQSNLTGDIYRGRLHGRVLVYKHRSPFTIDDFLVDVEKLSKTRHENTLLFLGAVADDPDHLLIVIQPPKSMHSLHQLLNNPRRLNKLPASLKWNTAHQLSQAIAYLHAKDVCVGGALHSGNVFLESKIKLSHVVDFGFGPDMFPRPGRTRTRLLSHLAPELQSDTSSVYTPESDSYAFGSLLFELFAERKPFHKGQLEEPLDIPEIPTLVQKLIAQCWTTDPQCRPTFSHIAETLRRKAFFLSRHSTSQPDKLDLISAGGGKNAF